MRQLSPGFVPPTFCMSEKTRDREKNRGDHEQREASKESRTPSKTT